MISYLLHRFVQSNQY